MLARPLAAQAKVAAKTPKTIDFLMKPVPSLQFRFRCWIDHKAIGVNV
jgi:hypothetical protein